MRANHRLLDFLSAALAVVGGHAYLLGDDSPLCWLDGVITDCSGLEGVVVEWVEKPPDTMMTTDEHQVSCTVHYSGTTVVEKSEDSSLINHINIHSCNENIVLCVPQVGPDVATHSPAQNGDVGLYNHTLKLPSPGLWTTICHARIYSNATGTVRKIDTAVAHFGIRVTPPPVDQTPLIAGVSGGIVALALIVGGILGGMYIAKKNDVMLKFSDLIFDSNKPWRVTEASTIFQGEYNGIPVAIKKIKTKGDIAKQAAKKPTITSTISLSSNKVSPTKSQEASETTAKSFSRDTKVRAAGNAAMADQDPVKAIKKEMQILNKIKSPRIVQFIGCAYDSGYYYIATELMEEGSLNEVLANASVSMSFEQKLTVSSDVANGLRYLHTLELLHADIKSLNVFMSGDMRAKLGDFGSTCKVGTKQNTGTPAWMAPELLNCSTSNTKASDVYALAITLWETWSHRTLYPQLEALGEDKYMESLQALVLDGKRPEIETSYGIPTEVQAIIEKCWNAEPAKRPSAEEVDTEFATLNASTEFKSKYEETKDERAADLLYKILPAKIADQIRQGQKVDPIHCDMVTILFSDIVGFTEISSTLKSEEVMDMLSRLYDAFDNLTTKYHLFKVETIGDAYMVAGGLFDNQDVQAQMILRMGIDMIRAAAEIPVHPDMPELGNIKIRCGAHTGPVVASVVGSLNPRFCLFGDTVNQAARMESNSTSQRFQISGDCKNRISVEAPEFNVQLRGKIPIKGKGNVWTYWVESTNPKSTTLAQDFPPLEDEKPTADATTK